MPTPTSPHARSARRFRPHDLDFPALHGHGVYTTPAFCRSTTLLVTLRSLTSVTCASPRPGVRAWQHPLSTVPTMPKAKGLRCATTSVCCGAASGSSSSSPWWHGRGLRLQLPGRPMVYEAQTDLIYEQQLDVANPLTGQTYSDPTTRSVELQAVDAIIQSPTMTQRVDTILEEQGLPTTGYEVRSEMAPSRPPAPPRRAASSRSSRPARTRSWPRLRRRPTRTRSSIGARSA